MRINQNSMAINAYRNLSTNSVQLGKSLEKLSSGFRINRAADDAAGLVISQNLRAQVSGLRQATRNAQDGISVVQTAEGALNEVHTMLNRMRDLAVQAANTGSSDATARSAAQAEINALASEIDRIAENTKFGGLNLLDGGYGATAATLTGTVTTSTTFGTTAGPDPDDAQFTFDVDGGGTIAAVTVNVGNWAAKAPAAAAADLQTAIRGSLAAGTVAQQAFVDKVTVSAEQVGSTGAFALKIEVAGLADGESFVLANGAGNPLTVFGLAGTSAEAIDNGGQFQVGANAGEVINVKIASLRTQAGGGLVGVASLDVENDAASAITALDAAIKTVSTTRGELGAVQNRFESVINNLQVTTENLVASESRIRDTDMAVEMTNFTKNQILSQASTAMLAQANQVPQTVLQLLR